MSFEHGSSQDAAPSTPNELDPATALATHISTTGILEDLQGTLLTALERAGWAEKVRTLARELVQRGCCERFDEMVETVHQLVTGNPNGLNPEILRQQRQQRVRPDRADASSGGLSQEEEKEIEHRRSKLIASMDGKTSTGNATFGGDARPLSFDDLDLRIPQDVVDTGVRLMRKIIKDAFEFEDEDDDDLEEDGEDGVVWQGESDEGDDEDEDRNGDEPMEDAGDEAEDEDEADDSDVDAESDADADTILPDVSAEQSISSSNPDNTAPTTQKKAKSKTVKLKLNTSS